MSAALAVMLVQAIWPASPGERRAVVPLAGVTLTVRDAVELRGAPAPDAAEAPRVAAGASCRAHGRSALLHTVGAETDFWYDVTCGEARGWVLGSRTSLRLAERVVTMRATFERAVLGDYFHLVFVSDDRDYPGWDMPALFGGPTPTWDFGFGNEGRTVGGYRLESDAFADDGDGTNPEYEGKRFEVRWTVRLKSTPPGYGQMEPGVDREVPTIVGLKLLN